ncbi:hypothetical protein MRX96_054947 [Rhipicephalus microplus]
MAWLSAFVCSCNAPAGRAPLDQPNGELLPKARVKCALGPLPAHEALFALFSRRGEGAKLFKMRSVGPRGRLLRLPHPTGGDGGCRRFAQSRTHAAAGVAIWHYDTLTAYVTYGVSATTGPFSRPHE